MNETKEALQIWSALKPMITKTIDERTKSCVRSKKMMVVTAPNGSTIGVKEPFDTVSFNIPYSSSISSATVGDTVWVQWYFDNASTMIAMSFGDGDIGFYPYKRGTALNTTATTSAANQWVNTGLTVTLTSNHIYAIGSNYAYGLCFGIQLRPSAGTYTVYEHIAETGGTMSTCMPVFFCQTGGTYQLWVKRGATGANSYQVYDLGAVST